MSFLPEDHVYSFSQLSGFNQCKYGYYLKKIEHLPEEASNPWAEKGMLVHDLLDKWAKGELSKRDMLKEYQRRYGEEVESAWPRYFPSGYAQKMFDQGWDFIESFDEFEGYDVLAAEEKYESQIELPNGEKRPFTGIIDMILKDQDDNLIICDHKSKSESGFKKAEDEMYKQLYMYAQHIQEKYGEMPKYLMFHLFNCNGEKPFREFDPEEYDKVMKWAGQTIQEIEDSTMLDWLECKEKADFHCWELCPYRKETCPMGIRQPSKKKKTEKDFYYENNE